MAIVCIDWHQMTIVLDMQHTCCCRWLWCLLMHFKDVYFAYQVWEALCHVFNSNPFSLKLSNVNTYVNLKNRKWHWTPFNSGTACDLDLWSLTLTKLISSTWSVLLLRASKIVLHAVFTTENSVSLILYCIFFIFYHRLKQTACFGIGKFVCLSPKL